MTPHSAQTNGKRPGKTKKEIKRWILPIKGIPVWRAVPLRGARPEGLRRKARGQRYETRSVR